MDATASQLDAEQVGEADVGGFLAQVKIHHPGMRELERLERGSVARADRGLDLGRADLQSEPGDIDAVEPQRKFGQRRVAALADVFDDVGDARRRRPTTRAWRPAAPEALVEIRRLLIERDRHG